MNDHCREEQIESVIVSLDAMKAFDPVDHGYICRILLLSKNRVRFAVR